MIGETRRNVVGRRKIGGNLCRSESPIAPCRLRGGGVKNAEKTVGNAHPTSHSIATIRSKLDAIRLWAVFSGIDAALVL